MSNTKRSMRTRGYIKLKKGEGRGDINYNDQYAARLRYQDEDAAYGAGERQLESGDIERLNNSTK